MINLNTRFNWIFKFADIEITDKSETYILQIGYVHSDEYLYVRLWRDNEEFMVGCEVKSLEKNSFDLSWISLDLRKEIVKQAKRVENLKAFV